MNVICMLLTCFSRLCKYVGLLFLRKGGEIEFLLLFYECVCLSSYVERYFVFIFDDFFVVDEKCEFLHVIMWEFREY